MKVTETMIEAFFRDELNEYQKELVKEYFRQYPEALQKYLTEKSWEDFTPPEALGLPVADKMFRIIESATYGRNKIRRIYYQCAAVAAALFILGFGFHLLTKKAGTGNLVPAPRENSLSEVSPKWKQEINNTGKTMKLSLKDGSLVELSSGSELSYREPFAPDKRDVYLTGRGLFNVGKDKIRPFTVYAGGIHITALGTVFRVVSLKEEGRKTEVHLLSGKVVVRPDSLLEKRGVKEIYLDQGQSLLPGASMGQIPKSRLLLRLRRYLHSIMNRWRIYLKR
jgi:transmembrane sensor